MSTQQNAKKSQEPRAKSDTVAFRTGTILLSSVLLVTLMAVVSAYAVFRLFKGPLLAVYARELSRFAADPLCESIRDINALPMLFRSLIPLLFSVTALRIAADLKTRRKLLYGILFTVGLSEAFSVLLPLALLKEAELLTEYSTLSRAVLLLHAGIRLILLLSLLLYTYRLLYTLPSRSGTPRSRTVRRKLRSFTIRVLLWGTLSLLFETAVLLF